MAMEYAIVKEQYADAIQDGPTLVVMFLTVQATRIASDVDSVMQLHALRLSVPTVCPDGWVRRVMTAVCLEESFTVQRKASGSVFVMNVILVRYFVLFHH